MSGAALTLEQQFAIRSFETQVQQMSETQAKDMLMSLYEQMLCREAIYKDLLKKQWGIDPQ